MAEQKKKLTGDVYYPDKEILKMSRVKDYDCLYSNPLMTGKDSGRRKPADLKGIANDAMRRSPTIESCITVKRTGEECFMESDDDSLRRSAQLSLS